MLRQSIIHPHLSAYRHIFGELNYNRTPLSPSGTIIVIQNRLNNISSWAPHGEFIWYIGPTMEHYRLNKAYNPKKYQNESRTQ